MSRSTADVTVGLDNRLKRYSAVAVAVVTLPVAGVAHAGIIDGNSVTSKKFTVEDFQANIHDPFDSFVVSWLQVDLDHDLASTGKGEFNGVDVLLLTFSDFTKDGAPIDDPNKTTAFGMREVSKGDVKVVVDAGEAGDAIASRFADEASVNFDNLKDDAALLFWQGFDDGNVGEEGNFQPGSGSGLLAFAQPMGPKYLEIQVNEDFTITAFGVTAVPEPTTWALMALGVAGMAGVRRATRKPAR